MKRLARAAGGCGTVAMLLVGCGANTVFQCKTAGDCGTDGRCEVDGFCTFPDRDCESGRRYGDLSGGGKAGTCLAPAAAGSSGPDLTSGGSVTSTGPGPGTSDSIDESDSTAGTGESTADSGTTGGPAGTVEVDGEIIEVADGWSAGVWVDFSDSFAFVPVAFDDSPSVYSNAPQAAFILRDPFPAGLGLITVHTIIELRESAYTERFFFGATPSGPDALWNGVDCSPAGADDPHLCIGAASQGSGDGIFDIAPSWTMSLFEVINNTNGVGFDADGAFEGRDGPELYYGVNDGLFRHPGTVIAPGDFRGLFAARSSGIYGVRYQKGLDTFVRVAPGTHTVTVLHTEAHATEPVNFQNRGGVRVADGDHAALLGEVYAVVRAAELRAYTAGGDETVLARSLPGQGWRWAAAVVPEAGHPLAEEGPTIYILEANRADDIDRVIWLRPP